MIKIKMILYYILAVIVLFTGLVSVVNEYHKYKYNKSFYDYDYETYDVSLELRRYLADSPIFRYTILEDKYDINYKNNRFLAYSLDLSSASSFFDIEYAEKLSYIPDNAIVLPLLSKKRIKSDIGDSLVINVGGVDYTYQIYGYYKSGNPLIVYTNVSIDNEKEKLLISVSNDRAMEDLRHRFNIITTDSKNIEEPFVRTSKAIFTLSIIAFSISLFVTVIIYFKIRKEYIISISDLPNKLENAGVKRSEIKRLIFNSEFAQYIGSLTIVSIILFLVFLIYKNMISEILSIYLEFEFMDYLLYIFMIFIFYNIILVLEYLLGRGYYEKKES